MQVPIPWPRKWQEKVQHCSETVPRNQYLPCLKSNVWAMLPSWVGSPPTSWESWGNTEAGRIEAQSAALSVLQWQPSHHWRRAGTSPRLQCRQSASMSMTKPALVKMVSNALLSPESHQQPRRQAVLQRENQNTCRVTWLKSRRWCWIEDRNPGPTKPKSLWLGFSMRFLECSSWSALHLGLRCKPIWNVSGLSESGTKVPGLRKAMQSWLQDTMFIVAQLGRLWKLKGWQKR